MAVIDNLNVIIVIGGTVVLGQTVENVFALRVTTSGGGLTSAQGGQLVRDWMNQVYQPLTTDMTSGITFSQIVVKNRTQGTDVGTFAWDTTAFASGSTANPLPPGNAPLVTFPTQQGKTRGRKFFGGYTVNALTNTAQVQSSVLGRLASVGAFMLSPRTGIIAGVSVQYVVVSEGVGAFTALLPTAANARSITAYQRRRKQGVGA